MKILHVLCSQIFSGAEKVACEIIRSFRDVPELTFAYCSPDSQLLREMLPQQGVTYVPMPEMSLPALRQVIAQEQPDVIHAHDMRASFLSALACGSIPLISHIHNNAYDNRGLTAKSVAYLLAGWKAKKILWVSRSSFEGYCFHRLFAGKSQILYNVIDESQIFAKLAQDERDYDFHVIFIGRLTYQKNPQRLMELCAQMKARKPDLKVAVVGTGELEQQTRELAKSLGLENTVQFLGFQKNPMKMLFCSRVMVLPSRWEGTPMCALEAMALGTPVVSTPSDGMKELIDNDENGWLCETDQDLVDNMLKIIENPDCRRKLSENTKKKFAEINDAPKYRQAIAACYGWEG